MSLPVIDPESLSVHSVQATPPTNQSTTTNHPPPLQSNPTNHPYRFGHTGPLQPTPGLIQPPTNVHHDIIHAHSSSSSSNPQRHQGSSPPSVHSAPPYFPPHPNHSPHQPPHNQYYNPHPLPPPHHALPPNVNWQIQHLIHQNRQQQQLISQILPLLQSRSHSTQHSPPSPFITIPSNTSLSQHSHPSSVTTPSARDTSPYAPSPTHTDTTTTVLLNSRSPLDVIS